MPQEEHIQAITMLAMKKGLCNAIHPRKSILACILMTCSLMGFSQRPLNFNQNFSQRGQQSRSAQQDTGPDSTTYQYFLLDSTTVISDITDSLADIAFLYKNSAFGHNRWLFYTGNYGAATMNSAWQVPVYMQFNPGFDQYHPYQIRPENFRFYQQNRPITDLYFSQFGTQENITAGAAFSRNFKDRITLSLNYLRISQKGLYNAQKTRSTAFGLGLSYESISKKYRLLLLLTNNANEETHNGGVLPTANLDEPFRQVIPVLLADATTRQQERHFSATQFFYLSRQADQPSGVYIKNTTFYAPSYYKFTDKDIDSLDQHFYHGLATDPRGIRRYLDIGQWHNGISIHGKHSSGFLGSVGLDADVFRILPSASGEAFWRTDLTAVVDGKLPIGKALQLNTNVRLGLGQNAGNFDAAGSLRIKAGQIGALDAGGRFFRSEQAYRSQYLNVNDEVALQNDWNRALGTVIHGTLSIPRLNTKIGAEQWLIQNAVYWDTTGLPVQKDAIYSLSRLSLSFHLKAGPLVTENKAIVQLQSNELYPVPSWMTRHQLYYHGFWFSRVMEVNAGVDAHLYAPFQAPAFQPLFGTYHLSNTSLPLTPLIHVFFMARVSTFRAKFIMENAGQWLFPDQRFLVENHPLNPPTLRFAIEWLLKD